MLFAVVLFDALGWLEVLPTAGLGVTSLLLLRTITVQEALDATRPRILLIIASSFALGAALQVRMHTKGSIVLCSVALLGLLDPTAHLLDRVFKREVVLLLLLSRFLL